MSHTRAPGKGNHCLLKLLLGVLRLVYACRYRLSWCQMCFLLWILVRGLRNIEIQHSLLIWFSRSLWSDMYVHFVYVWGEQFFSDFQKGLRFPKRFWIIVFLRSSKTLPSWFISDQRIFSGPGDVYVLTESSWVYNVRGLVCVCWGGGACAQRWGEGVTMVTRPWELFVGSKVPVGDLNMKHNYLKIWFFMLKTTKKKTC